MLEKFGLLQATMVHERRHKQYKETAFSVLPGPRYERTCMELLLNRQSQLMQSPLQFAEGTYTVGNIPVPEDLLPFLPDGDWQGHRSLSVKGMWVTNDDIVFIDGRRQTGEVRIILSKNEELLAIVDLLRYRRGCWRGPGNSVDDAASVKRRPRRTSRRFWHAAIVWPSYAQMSCR